MVDAAGMRRRAGHGHFSARPGKASSLMPVPRIEEAKDIVLALSVAVNDCPFLFEFVKTHGISKKNNLTKS
jgi:hypothetical protein